MSKHDNPGRTHFVGDECPGGHVGPTPKTKEPCRRFRYVSGIEDIGLPPLPSDKCFDCDQRYYEHTKEPERGD
jgi:hypothetical protein